MPILLIPATVSALEIVDALEAGVLDSLAVPSLNGCAGYSVDLAVGGAIVFVPACSNDAVLS